MWINVFLIFFIVLVGYVEPVQKESSDLPLQQCPKGRNWKLHEESGYCFWETAYEVERLNWFEARDFCKVYGGDLASYENDEQEMTGLAGALGFYDGLWMGLRRDGNDEFHWTDGTTVKYTNWGPHQPKLSSMTKYCVTHAGNTSKWELDYCGVRRWFVCKAPKGRYQADDDMDETPEEKKRCEIPGISTWQKWSWYQFQDQCYYVEDHSKYTCDTGHAFCREHGAHIASIHSFEETNFILSLLYQPETNFWITLDEDITDNYYNFSYWSNDPPEAHICVNFNKRDGSWEHEDCNRFQGVICTRDVNSTDQYTAIETPTVMPGNCENGWYNYGDNCYKFFGNQPSGECVPWTLAKTECEKVGASLASIHSQEEQYLLTDIVVDAKMDLWIGLRTYEEYNIFYWIDDSRIDYTNWALGEPEFQNDSCVAMEHTENSMGKWNEVSCLEKKAYLCKKYKNVELSEPYQNLFDCPNITGWYRRGSLCYGFFEQQEHSWYTAQAECKKFGADLISFRNADVTSYIKRKLKRKDSLFWIGAREQMKYVYVDGSSMNYKNWIEDVQPANCVAMTAEGQWVLKSCDEKFPFICKYGQEPELVPEIDPLSRKCEPPLHDWYDFGSDNCYRYTPEFIIHKLWSDAMEYCFAEGGFLASFHSYAEIKELRKRTEKISQRKDIIYVHIGLGRQNDGSFSWLDGSPLDFTNWAEGEPGHEYLNCVKMSLVTGKWSVSDCNEVFIGFVCSAPKSGFLEDAQSNNSSLRKGQTDDGGLEIDLGGIVSIVVCTFVVIPLIVVTVYYVFPNKKSAV